MFITTLLLLAIIIILKAVMRGLSVLMFFHYFGVLPWDESAKEEVEKEIKRLKWNSSSGDDFVVYESTIRAQKQLVWANMSAELWGFKQGE